MDWVVPLSDIDFGADEEQAVLEVLRSRWLTMGDVTREFEQAFSSYLNVDYSIAVTNGTTALHLACAALGIQPGDEVIVPSLSFVATANAVRYTGADVVFADIISLQEPCIDPSEIKKLITSKTRAVIVMHYAGIPCRMQEIIELCSPYQIAVIEDAAHAPGASISNQKLGTWGTLGCFSFFSNKNLITGEGGMVVTSDESLAEKIKLLRSHGMTSTTLDRYKGHAYSYDVIELGFNYRLDEIRSALGLVQLSKLDPNNKIRNNWVQKYMAELSPTGLILPFAHSCGEPSFHIMPVVLSESINRESFMNEMKKKKVQTSIHYPAIHQFTYYEKDTLSHHLPITEAFCKREVTLPLFPTMTNDQFTIVIKAVKESLLAAS